MQQEDNKNTFRSRLAPTPSGYLHLGNAFNFVLCWLWTRQHEGSLYLRIDDLDKARRRLVYLDDIFSCIEWLDLDYDMGPGSVEEFLQSYSQHSKLELYRDTLDKLLAAGADIYACSKSRKAIQRVSHDGQYPVSFRKQNLPLDTSEAAWRLSIAHNCAIEWQDYYRLEKVDLFHEMRDFVLRKKDGIPSYQISSLTDDSHMSITHIVRGQDLKASTAAQLYLARILGWKSFSEVNFLHHGLVLDTNQQKLSKSDSALSLNYMRKEGFSSKAFYQTLAKSWQLSSNISGPHELLEALNGKLIPVEPILSDIQG